MPDPVQPEPPRSLADALTAAGDPVPDQAQCGGCYQMIEAFALFEQPNGSYQCGHCMLDQLRPIIVGEEAIALAQLTGWETPEGAAMKDDRNRELERWRWTVMPDSPLTPACQELFLAYLRTWQRMTVDADGPDTFVRPPLPAFEYMPLLDQQPTLSE